MCTSIVHILANTPAGLKIIFIIYGVIKLKWSLSIWTGLSAVVVTVVIIQMYEGCTGINSKVDKTFFYYSM